MYIVNPLQTGQNPQTSNGRSRAIKPACYLQLVEVDHRDGRCRNVWAERDAPVWMGSVYSGFKTHRIYTDATYLM